MDSKHAKEILERYRLGTCSEEEKSWVENWHLQQLKDSSYTPDMEQLSAIHEEVKNKVDLHIRDNKKEIRRKTIIIKISTVAASLLLLIGVGYFSSKQSYTPSEEDNTSAQLDIQPGGNKALLLSSDGSAVELSEDNNTILVGDNISYAEGPDIQQGSGNKLKVEAVTFHTLQTPKAGEYNIVLSDGTKVWLNAYSSLKFPSRFDAKERLVELTGEAYFEVSPNKSKPFKVRSQDQTIEVLGTHFNVSAYQSESTKTTLLEGSVKIYSAANSDSKLLKPGQQSTTNRQSEQIQLANINPEHALAWKNGYFNFDNETLASIMSKIERWYDVEVEFEKAPSEKTYIGAVSRFRNLSAVLRALEETANVKFKRSGRKIIVTS
ncbi:FecR family protein [Sphingobacterium nematocida]|uniref:FecR family protein n=1 Tax=Sphingobacterium nematocida TaxID=1513896 RepID=A0A1T5GF06_9SPHI|nr:FecR domain-containing protein [Sphingobacterium nematocida]SKC06996.1 FecR family protein [Sphingobacterium nematocida]